MLAACYECGAEISTDAPRCPKCGYGYVYHDQNGERQVASLIKFTDSGRIRMSPSEEEKWMMEYRERILKEEKEKK